jgi:hypothetical protein
MFIHFPLRLEMHWYVVLLSLATKTLRQNRKGTEVLYHIDNSSLTSISFPFLTILRNAYDGEWGAQKVLNKGLVCRHHNGISNFSFLSPSENINMLLGIFSKLSRFRKNSVK